MRARHSASLPVIGNGQSYSDNLARERSARAELSQQHPVLAAGGNAVGTAAVGAALPLSAAAEGAGLLGKVGYGVMTGGAGGGVQGLSNSPDLTDIGTTYKDASRGAALGEVFGGAIPVAGAGFNAVRIFFANPEGAIVARALQGVDDATLARAQALMEDAQKRGITLTSAEAVQQASKGASGLGRLQRLTEGTTGGSAVLSPIMADRPGQMQSAVSDELNRIAPPVERPYDVAPAVQDIGEQAMQAAEAMRSRATAPYLSGGEK